MAELGYREDPHLTFRQRLENWWWYHWRHVLLGALAVLVLGAVLRDRAAEDRYDCSVALVTRRGALSGEIESLRAALEAVCPDVDGDGEVHVAVNAIEIDYTSTDLDSAALQAMAVNVDRLSADFYTRQSGIFLLDDPANFQANSGALAYLDGSVPPEGASDWENMTVPWGEWRGGGSVELESCQADRLWFGRRVLMGEKDEEAFAGEQVLWDRMFGSMVP